MVNDNNYLSGLVSIVVPVYKVEKYIDRCLKSIVGQTYSNIEIILVDDGSPDNSPHICDEWAKIDKRIRVIHKENQGLGMARNSGIELSNGTYICFVDSDDYLRLDAMEKAVNCAKQTGSDVVCYGVTRYDSKGKEISQKIPNSPKKTYRGEEVVTEFLPNLLSNNKVTGENWNLEMSSCMSLFSLKLIQEINWHFASERDIISEDIYSLLRLYKFVRSVSVLPASLYCYCQNESSLTQNFRKDRYKRNVEFYLEMVNLSHELCYPGKVIASISEPFLANTIAHIKQIVNSELKNKDKKIMISEIVSDSTLISILSSINAPKEKMSRKLFYFCVLHRYINLLVFLIRTKG